MSSMMDAASKAPPPSNGAGSSTKTAGEALLAAIKSGDPEKVGRAFRSAMAVSDSDDEDEAPSARKAPPLIAIIGAKKGK